ncbi:MAG: hypothetical protein IPL83_05740 [Bdellovibrionales bacterium]|nr:hypothetical protein [Bdellovibrionales bacterium]
MNNIKDRAQEILKYLSHPRSEAFKDSSRTLKEKANFAGPYLRSMQTNGTVKCEFSPKSASNTTKRSAQPMGAQNLD